MSSRRFASLTRLQASSHLFLSLYSSNSAPYRPHNTPSHSTTQSMYLGSASMGNRYRRYERTMYPSASASATKRIASSTYLCAQANQPWRTAKLCSLPSASQIIKNHVAYPAPTAMLSGIVPADPMTSNAVMTGPPTTHEIAQRNSTVPTFAANLILIRYSSILQALFSAVAVLYNISKDCQSPSLLPHPHRILRTCRAPLSR